MSYLKKSDSVVFDPNNKEHRDAVRDFMKRKAWADSSLKFTYDPAYGNVAIQVQLKLLQWYLDQEETRDQKKSVKHKKVPVVEKEVAFTLSEIISDYPGGTVTKLKRVKPADLQGFPKFLKKV